MMESGKRALFVPLVLRDAPASSGCLGYSSSCRWSACCCYANENISKLPEAAVVCRARVLYLFAEQRYRVTTGPELTWKYDAINNLRDDAFSNFISHSRCCSFSTFSLLHLPNTSLFISLLTFGAVYLFNQLSHTQREGRRAGWERGGAA